MIYPPRPEQLISYEELNRYEMMGYLAQIKMNGTCSIFETQPSDPFCYTRHQTPHKLWRPAISKALDPIKSLRPDTILVGELLHSKVAGGPKDTIYLFDIVQLEGRNLVGEPLELRLKMLENLFKFQKVQPFYYEVTDQLWVVKSFYNDFLKVFQNLEKPWYEGLVLKNPNAKLKSCLKKSENSAWQVKCRR